LVTAQVVEALFLVNILLQKLMIERVKYEVLRDLSLTQLTSILDGIWSKLSLTQNKLESGKDISFVLLF